MTKRAVNLRELALDMLLETFEKGEYSHIVLKDTLDAYIFLDKQQRSFLTRLFEGTVEYQYQIDYVINQRSSIKIKKMKPLIRNLLRLSVYQLLYMDAVPDSAVCNEAVKLAKKRGFAGLAGFVNGVLRNIASKKEQTQFTSLELKYAVPPQLIDLWRQSYSEQTIETMLKAFLHNKSMTIRCNQSRISVEELIDRLEKDGATVKRHPYFQYALELSDFNALYELSAFQEGLFVVQDVSSMFPAALAGIKKGDNVLDVCAAPGGKALHAADLLAGSGLVKACDLTERKVDKILENIERCQLTHIHACCQDARVLYEEDICKYDVVLADLPCSGLGVIGRKPDIKYRMTQQAMEELALLQREILTAVSQYVKPGGTLLYSTCTINPAENEENVKWLLANFPFEAQPLEGWLPENVVYDAKNKGCIQLLPGIHATDGFFAAKLKRKERDGNG